MPDRSLRLITFPPHPSGGGERRTVVLRERPSSPAQAPGGSGGAGDPGRPSGAGDRERDRRGGGQQDDNPFAPPPEGAPDRPWQPRRPEGSQDAGPEGGAPEGGAPWGGQWSDRQPGRAPDGFGERPGGGPQGPGGPAGSNMRWDPTDPVQRRARFALLSGMWAVFFALFSWTYVALLLGALALYWGVSALRGKPRRPDTDAPVPPGAGRQQITAAVGGLVTASLALVLVASTFTVQLVYRDYYTCVNDALTHEAKQSCDTLLPQQLRGVLGVGND